MFAEESGAETVKRADPDSQAGQQAFHPFGHFAGRFVGEGDGENVAGVNAALDEPRDPLGHHAGFARTGTGENQQRPEKVLHRRALAVGQLRPGSARCGNGGAIDGGHGNPFPNPNKANSSIPLE